MEKMSKTRDKATGDFIKICNKNLLKHIYCYFKYKSDFIVSNGFAIALLKQEPISILECAKTTENGQKSIEKTMIKYAESFFEENNCIIQEIKDIKKLTNEEFEYKNEEGERYGINKKLLKRSLNMLGKPKKIELRYRNINDFYFFYIENLKNEKIVILPEKIY